LCAGRLGGGFAADLLMVREARAMAPPVPASPAAIWDRRFRLGAGATPPPGSLFGGLSADASRLRRASGLPAAVLLTLPALRDRERLLAVPHLGWPDGETCARCPVVFGPAVPAAGAPFRPNSD
ncbi:MAG: hypothetical protein M3Y41_20725, partial [Pseudomonadota bacterium]|nr:hypothetical protein [Pseudomonadota bacterium]